jgi:tRNA G18 (ribose-2'-O)-methylase SpoU
MAKTKSMQLSDLKLSKNPLILLLKPQKPGNIGALLRTADAANLDAVHSKSKVILQSKHSAIQRWMFVYQPNCNWNNL